jgi:hypothetical protein
MGEQPPQERKIGELCTPDIIFFFWKELWGIAPQQQNILIKEGDPTNLQSTSEEENA